MSNNITMTEITSPSKIWKVSYNVDQAGTKITNLMTSGTFLDRNIGIEINTPTAQFTTVGGVTTATQAGWVPQGELSGGAGTISNATITPSFYPSNINSYFDPGSDSSYSVAITPQYTNTAGYIEEHLSPENGATIYYKIKTASLTAGAGHLTLDPGDGSVSVHAESGDSSNSNNLSLILDTSLPSGKPYYTLTAIGSGTVSGTGSGTVDVNNDGWITGNSSMTSNPTTNSISSRNCVLNYYIIKSEKENSVSNSSLPSGRSSGTYQDIEIQPYGYVKIPAGYNPLDRYVYANKANTSTEATTASNFSLEITNITGNANVEIGNLTNGSYPVKASNLSITGTFSANTPGWFSQETATDGAITTTQVGYLNPATFETSNNTIVSKSDGYVPNNTTVGTITPTSLEFTGGILRKTKDDLDITEPSITIAKEGTFFTNANTYGIVTTMPSGTDGTDYLTVHESHTATAGSAISSWEVARDVLNYNNNAGYLSAHSAEEALEAGAQSGGQTDPNVNIDITDDFDPYYIPILKNGVALYGGDITVNASAAITASSSIDTNAITREETEATDYYFVSTANASATRNTIYYGNNKGIISKNQGDVAFSGSPSPVSPNTPGTDRVYLKEANFGISANNAQVTINIPVNNNQVTVVENNTNINGKSKLNIAPITNNNFQDKYYITIKPRIATISAEGNIQGGVTLNNITPGYLPSDFSNSSAITGTATGHINQTDGNNYYFPIPEATITTSLDNEGMSTYFQEGTLNDNNVTITPEYTATAGYRPAVSTATNNGGTTYWKIRTTSVDPGTSTISNNTVTRGTVTWQPGWLNSGGEISAATFSNTAAEDVTYLDISNTGEAPILDSGGFLYINKGYTDDLKISLAKLIPDWPSGTNVATSDQILSGYKAYNQDGGILVGSISNLTLPHELASASRGTHVSDINRNNTDKYLNIPAGYHAASEYYTIKGIPDITSTLDIFGGDISTSFVNNTITATNTDEYKNGLRIDITRGPVSYSNAAGYISAHTNEPALSGSSNQYYLKGVKIQAPASGIACFDIEVPNGNTTDFIKFHFEIDAQGNVVVTDTHTT